MKGYALLSIIIPVFNGADFIIRLLRSIEEHNPLNELDYEVLLVNDGSSDTSEAVIAAYIKDRTQYHYYRKQNGGIASARAYGLRRASGTYITFCDQDDFVEHGYLKFINRIEEEKADILITEYQIFRNGVSYPANKIQTYRILGKKDIRDYAVRLIDEEDVIRLYKPENRNMKVSGSVWNCIFRKKVLDDNAVSFKRFIDYEDDWIFMIEYLQACDKAVLMPEDYYRWNMNEKSESHTSRYVAGFLDKRKAAVSWMKQQLKNLGCGEKEIRDLSGQLLNRRTLIWDFYNECYKSPFSLKNYIYEMNRAVKSEFPHIHYKKLMKTNESRGENIILFCLKHHLFLCAYLFNVLLYKHRYH